MTDAAHRGVESAATGPDDWFDSLEEGVVLFAGDHVGRVNRAAATLLDVDPQRAVGGRFIAVLRDHRLEALAHAVVEGAQTVPIEVELNGRIVQAVPITNGLLLRDRSAARQSERDAHELLAVLSHELRTPVTAIGAVLDALALDIPQEQREGFLARASEEAARLGRLIADLTIEVRPPLHRSVPLDRAVQRAVAVTDPVRRRRGVTVATSVPAVSVWVDADKLMQALVNLIENAAVHGPVDAVVDVVAEVDEASVRVEVRDTGAPLAPEVVAELFETTSHVSAKAKGTGLGLRIVRSLAKGWGGTVWAEPRHDGVVGNAFGFSVNLAPRRG